MKSAAPSSGVNSHREQNYQVGMMRQNSTATRVSHDAKKFKVMKMAQAARCLWWKAIKFKEHVWTARFMNLTNGQMAIGIRVRDGMKIWQYGASWKDSNALDRPNRHTELMVNVHRKENSRVLPGFCTKNPRLDNIHAIWRSMQLSLCNNLIGFLEKWLGSRDPVECGSTKGSTSSDSGWWGESDLNELMLRGLFGSNLGKTRGEDGLSETPGIMLTIRSNLLDPWNWANVNHRNCDA
ncbi:30816_t:CDS:2 [Racocetra persica]|uniref:30816_t:CDS:1 n=1 Tax=Racocetra persica TaxID=160502 RepID=A0ACA9LP02_9GLOM|nr:30816_t:CDS:2 [Racocetra persica]